MIRARNMQEYREMVRQALQEVQELEQTAEFDGLIEVAEWAVPLRASLEALAASMDAGEYAFDASPLDFMPLVEAHDMDVLPFRHLLQCLNWTHTEGLDETELKEAHA